MVGRRRKDEARHEDPEFPGELAEVQGTRRRFSRAVRGSPAPDRVGPDVHDLGARKGSGISIDDLGSIPADDVERVEKGHPLGNDQTVAERSS